MDQNGREIVGPFALLQAAGACTTPIATKYVPNHPDRQNPGGVLSTIYSEISQGFTVPEPQPEPESRWRFSPNPSRGPLPPEHQQPAPTRPVQGPWEPIERPSSPNGRMPGTWDALDYSVTEQNTTMDPSRQNETDAQAHHMLPESGANNASQSRVGDDISGSGGGGGDMSAVAPLGHDVTVDLGQANGALGATGSVDDRPSDADNHVAWAPSPPLSRTDSLGPIASAEPTQQIPEVYVEPMTQESMAVGIGPPTLLLPPVTNVGNLSQDHLSVSSHGDGGTSSAQESLGKKRLRAARVFDLFKSSSKKRSSSGKESTPELSRTNSLEANRVSLQKPERKGSVFMEWDSVKVDDIIGWPEKPCPTTWGELLAELAPLAPFTMMIETLQAVFHIVDTIRANKGHWRTLRSHCAALYRLLAFEYGNNANNDKNQQLIQGVCQMAYETIREIQSNAQGWSRKSPIIALIQYEAMARDIYLHIEKITAARENLNTSLGVTTRVVCNAILDSHKEERETTKKLLEQIGQLTDSVQQLRDQVNTLTDQQTEKCERDVAKAMQQHMSTLNHSQGDDEDIGKAINFIISLTGVQLPMEVFHKKICANVSREPISRGQTGVVYRATFAGEQSVAKKVLGLQKYREGDVKTYAEKMCRDVIVWQKFRSKYTLPCLGIGMERSSDGDFKMYMLSPLIERKDAMQYLKSRREFKDGQATLTVGKGDILRIAQGAALGLVEVHRHGSVHSNMRGDNVLVGSDGMGILGGFGLTKSLQSQETGKLAAVDQTGVNPPYRWMAPECANSAKGSFEVTQPNDVWGWAMATLEIITGVRPIRSVANDMFLFQDTARSRFFTKRADYPEFEHFAHRPEKLWPLLAQCWNRNPKKRPTMKEVTEQLAQIIEGP